MLAIGGHSVLAHPAASILKLSVNLLAPVTALAAVKDFPDLSIQPLIIKLPLARLSLQPPVISAARHLKESAHLQYTPNSFALYVSCLSLCG